jgi:hypothetical protein
MTAQAEHNTTDRGHLTRQGAAQALTAAGLPIAAATLAKLAVTGGGPAYVRWNGRAIYETGALFTWARARTSSAAATTAAHSSVAQKR